MIARTPIFAVTAVVLTLTQAFAAGVAEVTAGRLNVRQGPSQNHRVVGQLRRGARVEVVGSQGGWRQITYRDGAAWVHGDYLAELAPPPPPPQTPPAGALDWQPPTADTQRVNFRGATVNQRTIELILRAEQIMADLGHPGFQFVINQGSYTSSVSASAGTHAGGGALDVRTRDQPTETVDDMVRALRRAGFAAWSRGRGHDTLPPHIHAIAIGDPEASSGALSQVRYYAEGLDGLRSHRPDPDGHLGREVPAWAFPALGWEMPPPPPAPEPAPEEPAAKPARKGPSPRRGMIGRFR